MILAYPDILWGPERYVLQARIVQRRRYKSLYALYSMVRKRNAENCKKLIKMTQLL